MKTIGLDVDLPLDQAYALAELAKRITFNECLANAVSEDEAYLMIHALGRVREALAEKGVSVR